MTDAGDHVRPGRSARFVTAIATIFCANGVALANWFPRIPETRTSLALGYDELGLALFGVAAGAMLFMPATGWLVGRIGSHAVTRAAAFAICAALPLVALAPSLPLLAAALFAFGAASGTLDVAMNAQATHGERRIRRRILSRLHGLFSVGTLVGAVMGGAAASAGVPLSIHLAAVAVLLATVIAATVGGLLPDRDAARDPARTARFALPSGALWGLGAIGFCGLLIEGAMADWSAVYLRDTVAADPALAATGFAAFALTMTAGRLAGDWLVARIGPARLLRTCGLVAVAGLLLVVAGGVVPAVAGFALVGAGVSIVFPVVVRTAAGTGPAAAGGAIAAVSTAGYAGLLAGPPVIGYVADAIGLRQALAGLTVLGLLVTVAAGAARGDAT